MTKRRKESFTQERQSRAKTIVAKTKNQEIYMKLLQSKQLVVAEGSAGSGKTFLAASIAANRLLKGEIQEVYLTRPYIAMGRSTGLWPGTIREKLEPFLTPILNVFKLHLGINDFESRMDKSIHLQPIEAIRGMSFDNCMIICDEAQNLLPEEVKSLVTRLGENAQLVLCGDTRQKDIKGEDGLTYLKRIIKKYGINGTGIVEFTPNDIVRSGLVKEFVIAFDEEGKQ